MKLLITWNQIDKVDSKEIKLVDKNEMLQNSKSKFSLIIIVFLITINILFGS